MSIVKREAELREQWKRESWIGQSFESFLVKQILKLEENEDPHGHVISVRLSDLEAYFAAPELEFVTETMLEDIAETIWNSDSDGWTASFNQYLEATMFDNIDHWHSLIEAEKKRRQGQ